ncbi:Transposable element Tcb2 transposase [Pyrenophora seminiperda CCB06]|uniref:Transposable element Tcb2 transposase n=1 Tax=Pyrenophora seminiperda CCB06 TaxID=1302712 RepID=A0A3M7LUS4_9PLEO|nr:Transposable element Tcb2 transposase [Pyrenophora seminiperda CCB06]
MAPHTVATRAAIVAFKVDGKTNNEITALTGVDTRTIQRIVARAIARGFDPDARPMVLLNHYFEDAPRSGRPSKRAEVAKRIEELVNSSRDERETETPEELDPLGELEPLEGLE